MSEFLVPLSVAMLGRIEVLKRDSEKLQAYFKDFNTLAWNTQKQQINSDINKTIDSLVRQAEALRNFLPY